MKTKLFTLFLALVTSVGSMFASTKIGDLYYDLHTSGKTATVVYYQPEGATQNYANLTVANIPATVTHDGVTYVVTAIEGGAFSCCGTLKSVTIPSSVTDIGNNAFSYCDSLKSVTWNAKKAVATVNPYIYHPFFQCPAVESVTIGEDVDSIPFAMFRSMDSLKTVVWNAKRYCTIPYYSNESISCLFPTNVKQITFGNKVEYIPRQLCEETKIKSVVIPSSVKTIGVEAFSYCYDLTSVIIGDGLETLEYDENTTMGVFNGGPITSLTCYATNPPSIKDVFKYYTTIYVPASSVNAYKSTDYWKEHTILPIGATHVETDAIHITSSEYYADIVWKAITNAASYELVIEFMGNTWRFTFNVEGILTSTAYHAPSRYDALQGTQAAGFSYTVMGLASGTTYNVTITAKAANGSTLNTQTASFTTAGEPQGIEDVNADNLQSKKIIRDGKVFILRGDKVYTTTGQEVW